MGHKVHPYGFRLGVSRTWTAKWYADKEYQTSLKEDITIRKLVGTRLAYFFTPRVFLQSLVQYNNQARVWTANARFAWLNTAGTGLFVVLNDGEEADGYFRWRAPQSRSLIVKYTRQLGSGS